MLVFVVAFLVSAVVALLLVRSAKMHAAHTADRDFSKPQKFHAVPVPRVGGVALLIGLAAGIGTIAFVDSTTDAARALHLLGCALPAFLAGLLHDITESWTPRGRLLATALSALLAYFVLDAAIRYTGIPGVDWVVSFGIGSLLATMFTVAGIANSMNIIDGMNGLASMCAAIMFAAIAYVAYQLGDTQIGLLALAAIGAVLGFFIWNFPAGLIFLGDGGAYLLGFLVAELAILLLVHSHGRVSPMFPLLVCIYPVFETLFSIYRRRVLRDAPSSLPDGIHLHSLIYRRVMRWAVGDQSAQALTRQNSMTSPFLWLLCMASAVPAMLFWDNTLALVIALAAFAVGYSALYWRIVRFRSPRWMRTPFSGSRSGVTGGGETMPPRR